jgi:hypothetical protein
VAAVPKFHRTIFFANLMMETNANNRRLEDLKTHMSRNILYMFIPFGHTTENITHSGRNINWSFPFLVAFLQNKRNAMQGGQISHRPAVWKYS